MTIYATPSEQFRPECLPSEQSQIFSMICDLCGENYEEYQLDPSELRITAEGNIDSGKKC